ncbi:MAG: orotidine-5'-phosphate decarboxylase [Candidatus Omnitrophota bacterium]
MEAKDRLIVALDVDSTPEAEKLIEVLSPEADIFKVGIAPFTGYGEKILGKLREKGKKVFLDLKFHDIPNTVRNAARIAAKHGVFMMNFHCLGGKSMLEAARKGAEEGSASSGHEKPLLLGVTILTSMTEADLQALGMAGGIEEKVMELAALAKNCGLNGVVASAKETRLIKSSLGKGFLVVTPGVRPTWAAAGDQKRVLTPKQAVAEGADYIVVGRPIIHADDPAEAARKIVEEIGS